MASVPCTFGRHYHRRQQTNDHQDHRDERSKGRVADRSHRPGGILMPVDIASYQTSEEGSLTGQPLQECRCQKKRYTVSVWQLKIVGGSL